MKFDVDFSAKITVEFSDPEHAKKYFLRGSEWSEVFYDFSELDEVVRHISGLFMYFYNSSRSYGRDFFLEGYGECTHDVEGHKVFRVYYMSHELGGSEVSPYIQLSVVDDVEVDYVQLSGG